MSEFICSFCSKTFKQKKSLIRHSITKHERPRFQFLCDLCGYCSDTKHSLTRHIQAKHVKLSKISVVNCPLCSETRSTRDDMVQHFSTEHDISTVIETFEFSSEQEFFNWKAKVEKDDACEFVIWRSKYVSKTDGSAKMTYRCHRDGYFQSESKGHRHNKMLGSNKINGHCPAKIEVIFHTPSKLSVSVCRTHVGHVSEVGRVRLSKDERKIIASKIAMKLPFDKILEEIKCSIAHTEVGRLHLVTRKDLLNIARQYNLKSEAVRHNNNCASIESWIHELVAVGGVVHFYKNRNILLESHPQLQKDDYLLVIMNDAQQEMLKKYGNNCVCFDSAHGNNSHGFELVTLMVLDALGQSFPCAFMISNRCDTAVIGIFLTVIRNVLCSSLSPNVLMSDMTETFYNAWTLIMGPPAVRLFCTWHVHRAWRDNLHKIRGIEKQAETFNSLQALLKERNKSAFTANLDRALITLKNDPDTHEFGLYFENEYKQTVTSWARCYCPHAGLGTNTHLERTRGVIERIYTGGKKPKRLDVTISTIMRFVRDKSYDRFFHLDKEKFTSKLSLVRERHQTSLLLSTEDVVSRSNNTWIVPSKSKSEQYKVKATSKQACSCDLRCTDCETCIHEYVCSCLDSTVAFNMCKHIHLIIRLKSGNCPHEEDIGDGDSDASDSNSIGMDLEHSQELKTIIEELCDDRETKHKDLEERKNKLQLQFEKILEEIECDEDVEIVEKLIQPIIPTIQARKTKSNYLGTFTCSAPKTMKLEK